MKKPETDPLKRRAQLYAAEDRDSRRVNEAKRRKKRRAANVPKWAGKSFTVQAPTWFSAIDNPNETIAFLNKVQKLCRARNRVFVDLSKIEHITSDAIVGIVFAISGAKTAGAIVRGSLPKDKRIRDRILASGFADCVVISEPFGEKPANGLILKQFRHTVVQSVAKQLILHARSHTKADQIAWKTCFGNLVEGMANTKDHAAKKRLRTDIESDELDSTKSTPAIKRPETWLAAVELLDDGSCAFTFVDFGMGILETAKRKKRFIPFIGETQAESLKNILRAEVLSSTGNPRRGKGLPRIASSAKRSEFVRRVVIIANSAYGSPASPNGEQYVNLSTPFSGTMIYWEVGPTASQ